MKATDEDVQTDTNLYQLLLQVILLLLRLLLHVLPTKCPESLGTESKEQSLIGLCLYIWEQNNAGVPTSSSWNLDDTPSLGQSAVGMQRARRIYVETDRGRSTASHRRSTYTQ